MSKFIAIKITYYFFLSLAMASSALALPTYNRVSLPYPESMLESEKEMAAELIKLEVYQDSHDKNLYYYVPPFHIREYTRGAAGPMINVLQVEHYAEARKLIVERQNYSMEYSLKRLEYLQKDEQLRNEEVIKVEQKLDEAMGAGNPQLIELLQKRLAQRMGIYEKSFAELTEAQQILKNGGSLWPEPARARYNLEIVGLLIRGGANISPDIVDDPKISADKINEAMATVENSYGGFLSVNAYAGFTKAQLEALRAYKAKYMPNIRVTLMPVENISFFGLTEHKQANSGSRMFREFNGSGDYLGATIVMDITIAGAFGFAQHLAPFILPIGVKAALKQQLLPTEAELKCDFTNGYSVKGRSDVRDGLFIFDNDVTIDLDAKDHNYGACNLIQSSGDPNSAQYKALEKLEEELEKRHFQKTSLSEREKEKYYNGVLDDVKNNRRNSDSDSDSGFFKIVRTFTKWGWTESIVKVAANVTNFHWHTNIQNVSNLSKLKFDKKISIKGHTTIEKDFPTSLCLVFNKEKQAYDRCTEEELEQAKNMQDAAEEAANSPECKDAKDPFDCGRKRDEAGAVQRHGISVSGNETMVDTI